MVAWFVVCLKTCKLARDVSQKAFKKNAQVHLAIQMYSRVKFKGVLCSSGNTALLARSTQPNQWEAVAGLSSLFGNLKKKKENLGELVEGGKLTVHTDQPDGQQELRG